MRDICEEGKIMAKAKGNRQINFYKKMWLLKKEARKKETVAELRQKHVSELTDEQIEKLKTHPLFQLHLKVL